MGGQFANYYLKMINERIIYPDGSRQTCTFAKQHQVGDHFFDVSGMCIVCWEVIEVKNNKIKVQRHANEQELIKTRFSFLEDR